MSSNLKVNTILPSTGTSIGIGTAGGNTTISGAGTFLSDVSVAGDFQVSDVIKHAGDVNTKIRFPAVDTITAETSGSERLRITSSGLVGIGTNNPAHILDLYNADGTDCLKLNVSTAAGGSNKQNAIRFSVDSVVKAHMGVAVDAGRIVSGSSANDFCLKTNQATDILIAPNGSIGLRITSAGTVGINTHNPTFAAGGGVCLLYTSDAADE